MLVLGGGVVVGAVLVGSPDVGGEVKVVAGAGATGASVVVVAGVVAVVVTVVDVVGDVEVGVEPPRPLDRSAAT
jgi:hypothetical protein